ncbi:TetR/AcrR family transcriptional regulator [Pseudoalteromonas obscura]|uniref:TetR/AcrR family transcriptional regulator n=1 Tax=Pseudoalteromonas obscura TaxID=3048491 RepID=A0ABT7EDZ1_9GAMM|nr:TetR/AcrR family transcriptional regulator [Pseudoalteromonas sp. P94(2023)]MDK2593487.1 TetR/AcrR family transcriptional regulator [Pseudoalteromonas sp. P94(2023)]
MKQENTKQPGNTRGRKRDSSRTDAIVKVALSLLLEVGFDRFRIQDVATKAGCGTGAIYRRWPTKESLIIEAIKSMPAQEAPVTDEPTTDLKTVIEKQCSQASEKPDLVPGLVAAMRSDKEIEAVVKAGFSLEHYRKTIARTIGEDHEHLDLLAEITPAVTLFRSVFTPESLNSDDMVEEILSVITSFKPKT